MAETITKIDGNRRQYTIGLPKIVILGNINETAREWIRDNTGLWFEPTASGHGFECQPQQSAQLVTLLMTYNYKTRYFNNWNDSNTLFLKHDHHVGFDVEHICFDCCEKNNISTGNMNEDSRLAC